MEYIMIDTNNTEPNVKLGEKEKHWPASLKLDIQDGFYIEQYINRTKKTVGIIIWRTLVQMKHTKITHPQCKLRNFLGQN